MRQLILHGRQPPPRPVTRAARRLLGVVIVMAMGTAAACSMTDDSLPGSLSGTWEGGNTSVSTVRFSDGGRIDMNGGECSGGFRLSAVDGNTGTVDTEYLQCPPIMDGYIFDATVTVDGDELRIDGPVINGNYRRV